VKRSLLARLHNPRNRICACDEACFCKTTRLGYALRWYIRPRFHRFPPESASPECKRANEMGGETA
jgi:hypothetical protein